MPRQKAVPTDTKSTVVKISQFALFLVVLNGADGYSLDRRYDTRIMKFVLNDRMTA